MLTFYRLLNTSRRFEGWYCLYLKFAADQDILPCLTLRLQALPFVGCRDVYPTTLCHIPKEHRCRWSRGWSL